MPVLDYLPRLPQKHIGERIVHVTAYVFVGFAAVVAMAGIVILAFYFYGVDLLGSRPEEAVFYAAPLGLLAGFFGMATLIARRDRFGLMGVIAILVIAAEMIAWFCLIAR